MKLKIYTVYDSKVGAYMRPFYMKSRGEAVRAWIDVSNDKETAFSKHPGDYTLFEIGEWDDENAQTVNYNTPISIGTALEYRKAQNEISNDTPVFSSSLSSNT